MLAQRNILAPNNMIPNGWLLIILGIAAIFVGLFGGVLGWEGQVILLGVGLPAILLFIDYRLGLIFLIALLPYANSIFMPKVGAVAASTLLLFAVFSSFGIHWVIQRARGNVMVIPVSRELLWLYAVPVTLAMVVGSQHMSEVPSHLLLVLKMESYNIIDYWIRLYVRNFVFIVLVSILIGAAIAQTGRGLRYVIASTFSGVLFAGAIFVAIVSTGLSADRLVSARAEIGTLGQYATDAGILLLGALAPALFMIRYLESQVARLLTFLAVLSMSCGILLTLSRGPVLALCAVVVYYLWRIKRISYVIVALALAVAGLLLAPSAIQERLLLGTGERSVLEKVSAGNQHEQLTSGRVWIWSQLIGDFVDSPLIGNGVTSIYWSTAVKRGVMATSSTHGLYTEMLIDLGIIGTICIILFYGMLWNLFRKLAADRQVEPAIRGYFDGAAAGLLGMMIYGLSNGHYFPSLEQLFFWVSVGVALGYRSWLRSSSARDRA